MYSIKNDSEIYIYDDIMTGQTGRQVLKALQDITAPVTLRINSYGGDVFEGIALYHALKNHSVNVYIDGICASAASVIAMSGKIHMPENAMMMIHNPVGSVYGESSDHAFMAALLDKIRDCIARIYHDKTGQSVDDIVLMMDAETWMNGHEAKFKGFADVLLGAVENRAVKTYDDGVKDERDRLRALDEIADIGGRDIVMRAKYETFQSASDIALDVLRLAARKSDSQTPPGKGGHDDGADHIAQIINRMRGGK